VVHISLLPRWARLRRKTEIPCQMSKIQRADARIEHVPRACRLRPSSRPCYGRRIESEREPLTHPTISTGPTSAL
jgi:hypothetical protein